MPLIAELRRRNVFRVALLYVVLGWFCLQIIDLLLSGHWIYRFSFGLWVICFPLVLIFSYIYEITPEGLRKEKMVDRGLSITSRTGRKINRLILVAVALSVALEIARWLIN
jgi:hypothetical protein